jgi:hypothetical protein
VREWTFRAAKSGRTGLGEVVTDFSADVVEAGGNMDATDPSLRSHSTDFGNFVADSVRAAMDADVALINAGSFRIDSLLPARIEESHLRDTFIYDNSERAERGWTGTFLPLSSSALVYEPFKRRWGYLMSSLRR